MAFLRKSGNNRGMADARIHVGIGGWLYPPWRGVFYPKDLPQDRELEFASRAVSAIEINSTYYRLQSPQSFAKWAATAPDDFVFTVKASRFCTNRRNLREAAEGIGKFIAQGIVELGEKLGPILWQLMPTKRFDPDEMRDFLALLPREHAGVKLRHAFEARNESFRTSEYLSLLREAHVANVVTEDHEYPQIADATADLVYARLRTAREEEPQGFAAAELERWSKATRSWSRGKRPARLCYVEKTGVTPPPTDAFVFVINGGKVRAPAAAQALIARLSATGIRPARARSRPRAGA